MANRWILIPAPSIPWGVALLAVSAALAAGWGQPPDAVAQVAGGVLALGVVWMGWDLWRSRRVWRAAPLVVRSTLPQAFALGVPKVLTLVVENPGAHHWRVTVSADVDEKFVCEGLPQTVTIPAGGELSLRYTLTPLRRGLVTLGITQLRWRTLGGSFEIQHATGDAQMLHIYPNFAAVSGYAWLAGDRRLAQIGIKTYAQRGLGTDFRQLSEYRRGESIRHIDWKATVRQGKPIVREFQDDRDQRVFFLLDCGRRMRADEGLIGPGGSHFDHALNALMLLAHVALKEGDEVGAMTFGNAPGQARDVAPRKGAAALNGLMNRLYDIEPGPHHSDYADVAQRLIRLQPRRALLIVITNFRDEDAAELRPALKMLRQSHLVLVASLRERVLRDIAERELRHPNEAVNVATAQLFEQSRRDAFARLLGSDALSVDVEPAQLATALVNRYHSVKKAGLL